MATSLKDRIEALPVILAGPILRRTTPDAVTVWIALKTSCNVTLTVFRYDDNSKTPILQSSSTSTVKLGEYLHVIAVTAESQSGQKIQAGIIYCYDLVLAGGDLPTTFLSLASTYPNGELSYLPKPNNLPSFALQPPEINKLRLFHASCRKPHAEGRDALPILDDLIAPNAGNPDTRPHLLFLTGDQIYADDVAKCLSPVLVDAANTLLGWVEQIPAVENGVETVILLNKFTEVPIKRDVGPYVLAQKVNGFTSTEATCHLFGLGEFYAMYLLTWSDVLWPPENELLAVDKDEDELDRVKSHRETVCKVRRALANIPTYMMFDDHEITDDWYICREAVNRLAGSRLGRCVLRNGLIAYAVFQAWGNTPERFVFGRGKKSLFDILPLWRGDLAGSSTTNENRDYRLRLENLVGIPPADSLPIAPNGCLKPHEEAIPWHYDLQIPNYEYEILVLNTRTMREYAGTRDSPSLLHTHALATQVKDVPLLIGGKPKVTIIISPPPVVDIPGAWPKRIVSFYTGDRELWSDCPLSLQAFLAATAVRNEKIVILAGDVHYGYAVRLCTQNTTWVNLVSSALKNQESGFTGTITFHDRGWAAWRPESSDSCKTHNEFGYRIDYIRPTIEIPSEMQKTIPILSAQNPSEILHQSIQIHKIQKEVLRNLGGWEVVGLNNIGEVYFQQGEGDPIWVIQKLYWQVRMGGKITSSAFRVSLNPGDPQ